MKDKEFHTLEELHEAYRDQSPIAAFWSWKAHLLIFFVYGGISLIFMSKPGHYYLGLTLAIVTAVVNGIWIIFKGIPMMIPFLKKFAVKVIDFICKPVKI